MPHQVLEEDAGGGGGRGGSGGGGNGTSLRGTVDEIERLRTKLVETTAVCLMCTFVRLTEVEAQLI